MKPIFAYTLAALLLLGACNDNQTSDSKAEKEEGQGKARAEKPQRNPRLSKGDAAERLLEYANSHNSDTVIIHTNKGDITIRLYKDTPMHRGNFLRLANKGYYDETYFHRVVPNFVIQGGGTDIINKKVKIGKYRVPAEIHTDKYIHKRGAVAMARYDEDNPNKESDSHEFYIVWGDDHNRQTLDAVAKKYGLEFSDFQRSTYISQGGSPHLDGLYTVFGEVSSGMDIVEEVVQSEVDKRGWPKEDVTIKMEVVGIK